MTTDFKRLAAFGWSNHFHQQLTPDEIARAFPVRVVAVHRNGLDVAAPDFEVRIPPFAGPADDDEAAPTVGDWLVLSAADHRPIRLLERKSLFKRKAAGTGRRTQLIAANVDTLLVVTSCNQDFNVARLERYLALAQEAGVMPVVVLTKADLVDDAARYLDGARRLLPGLVVEALDARGAEAAAVLGGWCGPGETVALLGSSGVGKSTLVNALAGRAERTAPLREADAHGRHTPTGRSLPRLAAGGWLIDTPGMRELQLADAEAGVAAVFADIVALSGSCRFADCRHEAEPGCAVRAAIDAGTLDPGRLGRFRKLAAEEARNSEALHERRARERDFSRMTRRVFAEKSARREV